MDPLLDREPLGWRAVWPIAQEKQLSGDSFANAVKDFDDVGHALHWPKIRHMHQDALSIRSILGAPVLQFLAFFPAVDIAIYEVVDHLDMVLDFELPQRALAQILGDCRNPVTLLDRETGDGQIGAVLADKSNVGSVKRSNEGQIPVLWPRREHLPGQHRAH